jgi:hypothetical protein
VDNVAKLTVRQQGAEPQALPPQDVLPRARFPVLKRAAEARQAAEQTMPAQRRVVQP